MMTEALIKQHLHQIQSLNAYSLIFKETEVQGVVCIQTTDAQEASPVSLICTLSQTQYARPFFSLSSDGVRALSLLCRRDADGWMTVG